MWLLCVCECVYGRWKAAAHSCWLRGFRGMAGGKSLVLAAGHYCNYKHKGQIWSCGICFQYLVQGSKVPSPTKRASCHDWRRGNMWLRVARLRVMLFLHIWKWDVLSVIRNVQRWLEQYLRQNWICTIIISLKVKIWHDFFIPEHSLNFHMVIFSRGMSFNVQTFMQYL